MIQLIPGLVSIILVLFTLTDDIFPWLARKKNTRESHWPERFDEETYVIVFNIATTWSPMQM